jgi:hypothetical protein
VRRIFIFAITQLLLLAACGGGSGGSVLGGSSSSGSSSGGSGSSGGNTIAGPGANVATMTVDAGPTGANSGIFNIPYVSVTVCAPGNTTTCQTIDHVEVDTGSYGLRIISSVLSSTMLASLPKEQSIVGGTLAECTQFGDGIAWGSMRTADVSISSEKAASVPIQVIGDPNYPNIPADCTTHGTPEDTVALFGANGILGVGPFVQDCGDGCVASTQNNVYFDCPVSSTQCNDVDTPLTLQAANPVATFTTDNNGVIVELPSIADAGAATATGALVFGIDTQSNNTLGKAVVLTTDTFGFITTTFNNVQYTDAFIDSGSNFNFIVDSTVTTCGTSPNQVFCPTSEISTSATNIGLNNTQSVVDFKIGDANALFNSNPSYTAFNNVASPNPDSKGFDLGLPFFYGRNVFTAIDGKNTSGGLGPYFAY